MTGVPRAKFALCCVLLSSGCAERQPSRFDRQLTCFNTARQVAEAQRRSESAGFTYLNPQYSYNDALDTCVLYDGMILLQDGSITEMLTDVLTNREIAISIRHGNTVRDGLSKEDFDRKRKELFPDAPR